MNPRIKLTIVNEQLVSALADGDVRIFIEDATGIHTIVPREITREEMTLALGGLESARVDSRLTETEHNRFPHGRFTENDGVSQQ
jgi:hypothetical protein